MTMRTYDYFAYPTATRAKRKQPRTINRIPSLGNACRPNASEVVQMTPNWVKSVAHQCPAQ